MPRILQILTLKLQRALYWRELAIANHEADECGIVAHHLQHERMAWEARGMQARDKLDRVELRLANLGVRS